MDLSEIVRGAFGKAFPGEDHSAVRVVPATDPKFGDYQCNDALKLAKRLRRNPREAAQAVAAALAGEGVFDKVEVAGPGFLNLTVSPEWLNERLAALAAAPKFGIPQTGAGKRVVITKVADGINKADDDQRKDFVARLMFFPIKDLSLSGYYLRSLGPDPGIPPQYNDYDYYVFDRYGGGITYDGKYAWFRSEYMAGHTFGWRAHGVYATAGGKINGKIGIGLRYDYFAENSRLPGGFFDHAQQHITAGFSWYVIPRIRLQLNYTLRKEPDLYPTHFVNFMTSISL